MITLATLKDATAQQVFDQVSTHLLTQMKQSGNTDAGELICFYRSGENNSLKCAAGCLISDDEYVPMMDKPFRDEGTAWKAIVSAGYAPNTHLILISELQNLHDEYPPSDWEYRLKVLADKFQLKFGEV